MAECICDIETGLLQPGVFNIKQFTNGTETMVWTVSSRYLGESGIDLNNYDAFLVLSVNGVVDEIILTKDANSKTIMLTWNIGKWATKLKGHVLYQIVFKSSEANKIGVISGDSKYDGTYTLNESGGYEHANSHSIKWDAENGCWALYDANGSMIDYQKIPNTKPYCGAWNEIAVSSLEGATWYSSQAIMYTSESIDADENIAANFPTILHQFYLNMQNKVMTAGAAVFEAAITADNWQNDKAPYTLNLSDVVLIPPECTISNVGLFEVDGSGNYTNVTNFRHTASNGVNVVYAHEKITGKIAVLASGGEDSVFISKDDLNNGAAGGVVSVNGKSGTVTLTAADLGVITYTAGENITISETGVISATGGGGGGGGVTYTQGDGISIVNNQISVDYEKVAKKGDIKSYSAGNGITISDDNKISIKGVPYFEEEQEGHIGLYMDKNGLHFAGANTFVTQYQLTQAIGDINTILDNINGEVI